VMDIDNWYPLGYPCLYIFCRWILSGIEFDTYANNYFIPTTKKSLSSVGQG